MALVDERGIPLEKGQKVLLNLEKLFGPTRVTEGEVSGISLLAKPLPQAPQGVRSVEITVKYTAQVAIPGYLVPGLYVVSPPDPTPVAEEKHSILEVK